MKQHRDAVVAEIAGFRPLTLDIVAPDEGTAPVILFIHGGAWLFGSPKIPADWLMVADPFTAALQRGFAVAFAQYRLSGEARFPAQLDDIKAAIRWLRREGGALGLDTDRLGVWGESAGGHLSSLAALTGDDETRVQAAVSWYAPSNFVTMSQESPADSPESLLIGGPVKENPGLARAASPITYVTPQAPPMLLVHGDQGTIVPHSQSEELARALRAAGTEVELSVIPGAGHCFEGVPLPPIVDATLTYFEKQLSGRPGRG